MRVGLGVEVEVELGRGEPGRRVGAERELVVGQLVDQRCGFGTMGSSRFGRSGHGVRERGHGERRRQSGPHLPRSFAALTARPAQSCIASYLER